MSPLPKWGPWPREELLLLEISSDFPNGHLYVNVSGNGALNLITIVPLSSTLTTDWHHVAIVGDKTNNNLKVYFDGSKVVDTNNTQ